MTLGEFLKQFENKDLNTLVVFSTNVTDENGRNPIHSVSKECEIKNFTGTEKDQYGYYVEIDEEIRELIEDDDLDALDLESYEEFKEKSTDLGEINFKCPVINIHIESSTLIYS